MSVCRFLYINVGTFGVQRKSVRFPGAGITISRKLPDMSAGDRTQSFTRTMFSLSLSHLSRCTYPNFKHKIIDNTVYLLIFTYLFQVFLWIDDE